MRKFNRGIAAAALSAPLVLGMTGVATAAASEQPSTGVGSNGSGQVSVSANIGVDGQVSYEENRSGDDEDGLLGENDGLLGEEDGLLGLGILG